MVIKVAGPKYTKVGPSHYHVKIEFFHPLYDKSFAMLEYDFDLTIKSDEEIFQAISDSFFGLVNLMMQEQLKGMQQTSDGNPPIPNPVPSTMPSQRDYVV
jgi:hypothetical protein